MLDQRDTTNGRYQARTPAAPPSDGQTQGLLSAMFGQYERVPPWLLLGQLFLASGWARAVAEHSLDAKWWSGAYLEQFAADHATSAVSWYGVLLETLVVPLADVVSLVIVAVQIVIAVLLALNVNPRLALFAAAFLNVNFMLAGAVNPSIFYLVVTAAIALWHLEDATPGTIRSVEKVSRFAAVVAVVALIADVGSLAPINVIADPALVLIHIAVLWNLAVWRLRRQTESSGPDDRAEIIDLHDHRPPPNGGGQPPNGGGQPPRQPPSRWSTEDWDWTA